MKYAWIENDKVRDICPGHPDQHYTPQVAAFYNTEVPDDTRVGSVFMGGSWVYLVPETVAYTPPVLPRFWTMQDVRAGMSLIERVKWDNDDSKVIKTAKIELQQSPNLEAVRPVLQMLVDSGDIAQETMDKVLA
jgi:hypothetical protein